MAVSWYFNKAWADKHSITRRVFMLCSTAHINSKDQLAITYLAFALFNLQSSIPESFPCKPFISRKKNSPQKWTKNKNCCAISVSRVKKECDQRCSSVNLLGTPETNFRGLRTRMALSVRRSTPSSGFAPTTVLEGSSGLMIVMYLGNDRGW